MQKLEISNGVSLSDNIKTKVDAAKQYIERRYSKLIQVQRQKKQNWSLLFSKMDSLNLNTNQKDSIKQSILNSQSKILRDHRNKPSLNDYQTIQTIGRGAFGEVRLCSHRQSNQPVAIKCMKKQHMVSKNKVIQVRQEKEILSNCINNQWIVQLKCSFQDDDNLYLAMEYVPGGDLMNLLIKKDIFTEEQARFYLAQMLLALQSIHQMGYIHRDIKPDNILIEASGHIKLSDFGLCKYNEQRPVRLDSRVNKIPKPSHSDKSPNQKSSISLKQIPYTRNRKLAYSAVGTPDYVAPQVQSKTGYTESADWWSLGVIMFEMLIGYPPFYSEKASQTWMKIQNWKKYLYIPKEPTISRNAIDLIRKLICGQKDRLGTRGTSEIKNHPFFQGVDWANIRNVKPPHIPIIRQPFDTKNFDQFKTSSNSWNEIPCGKSNKKTRKDSLFVGFTFKANSSESQLLKVLLNLDTLSDQNNRMTKRKSSIKQIEKLNTQISKKKPIFKKDKGGCQYGIQDVKECVMVSVNCWMDNSNFNDNRKAQLHQQTSFSPISRPTKKNTPVNSNRHILTPQENYICQRYKHPQAQILLNNKSPINRLQPKLKN